MKIANAQMQMAQQHHFLSQHEVEESLRSWVGPRPGSREQVSLSDAGRAAQASEAQGLENTGEAAENDPRVLLIKAVLAYLTGKDVKTIDIREFQATQTTAINISSQDTGAPPPPQNGPVGYGVDYHHHETYDEVEHTQFSANGVIRTADGKEISFQLNLSMDRSYHQESDTRILLGDAARKTDPLVINFGGNAAQLTDATFRFDLNSDGHAETLHQLAAGSGYLVLDRNHNGKVDNGQELFGPASGNGFADLARLDEDGNGWIDENDSAWQQLQVWIPQAEGNQLQGLAQLGVGALALQHQATPFSLTNSANQQLGQVVSSGVYLREDGSAGSLQQIDLVA